MMTTGGKAFVDTNILLRTYHDTLDHHTDAKALVYSFADAGVDLWISRQVIREYLVQATHPRTLAGPEPLDQTLKRVASLQDGFMVADETPEVTDQLLELLRTYPTRGKQVHDANIVATMLVNGVDTLLTMNVADFQRFHDRINLIPLRADVP